MERALDPALLRLALGDFERLPSPDELAATLADVEVELVLGRETFDDRLLGTAWFLHAVAASPDSLERYGRERQRAAYQVAGHVFDLRLATGRLARADELLYCFAAQTAFLGSELDPNTLAIYRRSFPDGLGLPAVPEDPAVIAMSLAVMLLGGAYGPLFPATTRLRDDLRQLARTWGLESWEGTRFAALEGVGEACRDLAVFLSYGRADRLDSARERLTRLLSQSRHGAELTILWVASHLRDLTDHIESSSVWTGLPPTVLPGVRSAFALGEPRAPMLWPPQLELLGSAEDVGPSCLSDEVRRAFVSMPTSGGKTLVAQLIIADHLARNTSAACYIAPTRSLCGEVRRALQGRLRYLGTGVQFDQPFFYDLIELTPDAPRVEVMTPERLAFMLRSGADSVLDRFGLFVFDEVHMAGEGGRGWILESTLTYLHSRTCDTAHRIICVSAAIGNRAHFAQWLEGAGQPFTYHREWRGPRRLHCLWGTEPRWNAGIELPTRSRKYPVRREYPLHGRITIRAGRAGVRPFVTTEPVGRLVLDYDGTSVRSGSHRHGDSTPAYQALAVWIAHLATLGPVLVIESTRRQALRTASAVADRLELDTSPETQVLRDLIATRMTRDHPLSAMVSRGVAYHHGSLPLEIRSAIEEAISDGDLRCLVATATMTEGVNLPVRSVVIASTGAYTADGGFEHYITGPKLVNALGRAGRSAIETEGILVFAPNRGVQQGDFELLTPTDEDLRVESQLASPGALETLALFEQVTAAAQDRVIEAANGIVGSFMSYVWFVALELERVGTPVTSDAVTEVLARSLAWIQLDERSRAAWAGVIAQSVDQYLAMPVERRVRWASSGARPKSSRTLDSLATSLVETLAPVALLEDPLEAIRVLLSDERQQLLSQLEEFPAIRLRESTGGPRREIAVNLRDVCLDWVSGIELGEIASKHLGAVADLDFRFEQLSDYVNEFFEMFLPWTFGVLHQWVVDPSDAERKLLPEGLASLVRYGVSSGVAVTLMREGIQSRRLAMSVARAWMESGADEPVRDWVGRVDQSQWAEMFQASPGELRSLLEYARPHASPFLRDVLDGRTGSLTVAALMNQHAMTEAALARDNQGAVVWIECDGERVGRVNGRDHLDVDALVRAGMPLSASFMAVDSVGVLEIRLAIPED